MIPFVRPPRINLISTLPVDGLVRLNPYAQSALKHVASGLKGTEDRFRTWALGQGKSEAVEALDQFPRGSSDVARYLLASGDVRAYLLATAAVKNFNDQNARTLAKAASVLLYDPSTREDISNLIGGSDPQHPWEEFFDELVALIVKGENLQLPPGGRPPVEKFLRDDPPSLSGNAVVAAVRDYILRQQGSAEQAFETFKQQGEIPTEYLEDPRIRTAMIAYVKELGIDFSKAGPFDEYFALAFDKAIGKLADGDDPIQSKFSGQMVDWDFTITPIDEVDDGQIIPKNIRAAGALDYIHDLGFRMGAFKLCDALVLRWAHGALDIPDGAGATKLYRYWKLRDERSTPEELGLLFQRILNKGETKVLRGMVINEDFPVLWGNLMQEAVEFIEKREKTRDTDRGPSPVRLVRATKQLQYNLTEFMTGMAQVQTAEVYAQLRDALEILNDPEIVSIVAGGRRRSLWTVVERLSKEEFGTPINVEALRASAVDGNRVFQWIAEYAPGQERGYEFEDFLQAAESYIIAQASIQNDNADYGDDEDEFEEDDFGDDDFDDFDDDEF